MSRARLTTPRLVAFLRAINVGGHVVSMAELCRVFTRLGCTDVETFIASGNVIFRSRRAATPTLARTLETALQQALGYEVKTFLRSEREVADVAVHQPFAPAELRRAVSLNVGFLAGPLDAAGARSLKSLQGPLHVFRLHGREVYWLSRVKQGDSKISNVVFERTVGARVTFRGVRTIARLVEKFAFAGTT